MNLINKIKIRFKKNFTLFALLLIVLSLPIFIFLNKQKSSTSVKASENSARVYYGVFNHNNFTSLSDVIEFETNAQKPVSIIHVYQGWGSTNGTQHFQANWANLVRNHGSIPMITWEPWVPTAGATQSAYTLSNIINGTYDNYIGQFATDVKAWSFPLFLRFAHEMNGNWYPWSEQINGNYSGQYIQAWRHVHDIFTQNNVTNVTWVWCPNRVYEGSIPLELLYPGDAYVDWTCFDAYNHGPAGGRAWKTFSELIGPTYNNLIAVAPTKPIMIGEVASEEVGGSKADWIVDAFQTHLPTNFPQINAVLWFNIYKVYNWPIESSLAAQQAFASSIASMYYASNNYSTFNTSPIPPLYIPPTPTPTNTPTPTPTPTPVIFTKSFPTIADTYVSSSATNTNYGTRTYFWVHASPINITYMKFDLRTLAGKAIISAKLRMRVTDNSSTGNQSIKLVASTSWTETTLKYSNRPAVSSTVIGTLRPGGKHNIWVEADVTNGLKAKAGQIISVALTQTSTDGIKFASRETNYDPVLIINYQ